LIDAGFGYLTDDVCPIDLASRRAQSYPKPIALATGLVARFGPTPRSAVGSPVDAPGTSAETYVSAADLGGHVSGDARPRLVVVPRYADGSETEVLPVSRATALVHLAEQSFNFDALAPSALPVLAEMLRSCRCYRLRFGDATDAVTVISELYAEALRI
jgi:hypothetical protein